MFSRLSSALQLEASGIIHAIGMPDLIGVADKLARESKPDFDLILLAFQPRVSSSFKINAVSVFKARGLPELINVARRLARLPQASRDAVLHAFKCYRRAYEIDCKRHAHQFECEHRARNIHPRWQHCSHAA